MTNCTIEALITAVAEADSADGLLSAVQDLAAARQQVAIPTLIEVLAYNNPGAAVAAVEGLIDIGEPAVPYLLANLDGYNYGARAWAVRAFAGIGDPRGLELLLHAASNDFSLSVRRAATRGLGKIQWSQLTPETTDIKQKQVLDTLLLVCDDGEWVVRYAAIVALESLAQTLSNFATQITTKLQNMLENDRELAVKARAKLALHRFQNTRHLQKFII